MMEKLSGSSITFKEQGPLQKIQVYGVYSKLLKNKISGNDTVEPVKNRLPIKR